MSIFLKNGYWWCDFTPPGGARVKRSLRTKNETEAQELHDKLKHESWRIKQMGDKPRHTLTEACVRWMREKSEKLSLVEDKRYIKFFLKHLPKGITVDEITADMVRTPVFALGGSQRHPDKQIANSTKNRYLAFIRSLLNEAAATWQWIDQAPKIKLLKEPKKRIRWLTQEEASRLISELPDHWKPTVRFALATGLRRSNIHGLRWNQVDLERKIAWIHPDEAKAGRAIGVALNKTAMDEIRSQIGKHPEFVFVGYANKPISVDSNTAWRKALKRAGIENFRFHDLRHTWASWLVQSGVGLAELQEMGGWESIEMVQRYAHLAPDHLRTHAAKLDGMIGNAYQAIGSDSSIENPNGSFTGLRDQEKKTS